MSKYIFVLRGQKLLWCILLQWSVRCKRSWPLTLQHWRAVLFSEVQPECKEVQCTVYFGKCTLAKCLLLQELLSAKVHSVHSVKCTVPSSLPKCAVHSAHLHSTQRTVHCAKYKVHSVHQLNCDASTAVAAL